MNNERYRAIIIKNGRLLAMKREKAGRRFCVLPGGSIEVGETPEECCARELAEEFGIKVRPLRMIYKIKQGLTRQGFFVAEWLSGEIHKTDAEEYTTNDVEKYGTYDPSTIALDELDSANLVPIEVREQLKRDLAEFGTELNRPLLEFKCGWN